VIDARVVAVTAGAAVLAALLFALVPGWQIARVSPVAHLQGSARTVSGGRSRQRIRASLVVVETALALMLLVGAGLLLRSLIGLEHVTPGFETRGLLMNGVALPERTYQTPEQRAGFIRALLERLRGAPGVTAVAAGTPVPFSGGDATASFEIEGTALGPGDPGPHGRVRTVTPGYFATLSIPLRQGRVFTDDDRLGSAPVAVIDENLARRYWPGQDPVGRRMRAGTNAPWMTIVGVVGRVLHSALAGETDKGTYYLCLYQQPTPSAWLLARLRPGAGPSPGIIGDAVASLDATLPVRRATSMEERLAASLAPQRFVVRVLAFFAGMALLLAALGLYGVISYSVAQRTQEIGVRMALGADRWSVLGLVLRQGVGLTLVGAAAGVVGAIGVARLVASQLFNVGPFDPVTFLGTVAVLLTTAVVATWLPARQASRVDPWRALRCE
jgi:predicted permease